MMKISLFFFVKNSPLSVIYLIDLKYKFNFLLIVDEIIKLFDFTHNFDGFL